MIEVLIFVKKKNKIHTSHIVKQYTTVKASKTLMYLFCFRGKVFYAVASYNKCAPS